MEGEREKVVFQRGEICRENGNEQNKQRCVKIPHEEEERKQKQKLQPTNTLTGIQSTYFLVALFVLSGILILVIFLDGRNSSLLRRKFRCFFLHLGEEEEQPVFFGVGFLAFPTRLGLNCCLPFAWRFGCRGRFGLDACADLHANLLVGVVFPFLAPAAAPSGSLS
jgi:hypothetical protein